VAERFEVFWDYASFQTNAQGRFGVCSGLCFRFSDLESASESLSVLSPSAGGADWGRQPTQDVEFFVSVS
jgi:hypothetical protein